MSPSLHALGRQHWRGTRSCMVINVDARFFIRTSPPRGLSASVPVVRLKKEVSPNRTELSVHLLPTLRC